MFHQKVQVMFKEEYPVGHPEIKDDYEHGIEWTARMLDFCGVVKAKVLPPTNLYIPVLPAHINEKLVRIIPNLK